MYIKVTNGVIEKYPYSIGELRKDNPQTSFPKNPNNALLAEWGVLPVEQVGSPSVDHTKNVTEGTPVNEGGWKQTWVVTDASASEIQSRTNNQAESVRIQRSEKLVECDWTQLSDSQVDKAVWATYRQSLRDIPAQAGFPWNVTWPSKP